MQPPLCWRLSPHPGCLVKNSSSDPLFNERLSLPPGTCRRQESSSHTTRSAGDQVGDFSRSRCTCARPKMRGLSEIRGACPQKTRPTLSRKKMQGRIETEQQLARASGAGLLRLSPVMTKSQQYHCAAAAAGGLVLAASFSLNNAWARSLMPCTAQIDSMRFSLCLQCTETRTRTHTIARAGCQRSQPQQTHKKQKQPSDPTKTDKPGAHLCRTPAAS